LFHFHFHLLGFTQARLSTVIFNALFLHFILFLPHHPPPSFHARAGQQQCLMPITNGYGVTTTPKSPPGSRVFLTVTTTTSSTPPSSTLQTVAGRSPSTKALMQRNCSHSTALSSTVSKKSLFPLICLSKLYVPTTSSLVEQRELLRVLVRSSLAVLLQVRLYSILNVDKTDILILQAHLISNRERLDSTNRSQVTTSGLRLR
jgi:hypothetical protein